MELKQAEEKILMLEKQLADVLKRLDLLNVVEEKKENKEKKEKKEKPETADKKKRAMTGYLLFSKEKRSEVKEELGDVKPTEVVTEVAKRWKALTSEEQEEWNVRAKETVEVA